jgi:hypothetical protein
MHSVYKKNRRVVIVVVWKEVDTKDVPGVDMGMVVDEDMEEGEADPYVCFNCGEIGHVSSFFTKLCVLCAYYYSPEHVT